METIRAQVAQAITLMTSSAFMHMNAQEQSTSKQGIVDNIVMQIGQIPSLSLEDANVLRPSFESQAFTPAHQGQLMHALAMRSMQVRAAGAGGPMVGLQTVTSPMEYMTQKDWDAIDSASALAQIETLVVARFTKLGLHRPSEKSIENLGALAALSWWKASVPPPLEAYNLCMSLKAQLRNAPVQIVGPQTYPASPDGLPHALRSSAYEPDSPPVSRQTPRFFLMKQYMVLRKSNKTLQQSQGNQGQNQGNQDLMGPMAAFMKVLAGAMGMPKAGGTGGDALNLTFFPPKAPAKAGAAAPGGMCAIGDAAAASSGGAQGSGGEAATNAGKGAPLPPPDGVAGGAGGKGGDAAEGAGAPPAPPGTVPKPNAASGKDIFTLINDTMFARPPYHDY